MNIRTILSYQLEFDEKLTRKTAWTIAFRRAGGMRQETLRRRC